jgi:hypothetical protein
MLADVDDWRNIEISYYSKTKICETARGNAEAIKRLKRLLGKSQMRLKAKW